VNLHDKIMNLNCVPINMDAEPNQRFAYKVGHRDARHAAAELALEQDALMGELVDVLEHFAKFPLEEFGMVKKPADYPISGWNDWPLHVGHIKAARTVIEKVKS